MLKHWAVAPLAVALLAAVAVVAVAPSAAGGSTNHLRYGLAVDGRPLATSAMTAAAQLAGERPSIEMW